MFAQPQAPDGQDGVQPPKASRWTGKMCRFYHDVVKSVREWRPERHRLLFFAVFVCVGKVPKCDSCEDTRAGPRGSGEGG